MRPLTMFIILQQATSSFWCTVYGDAQALRRESTCAELHKGELLLVVDVDVDHARTCTKEGVRMTGEESANPHSISHLLALTGSIKCISRLVWAELGKFLKSQAFHVSQCK